MKRFLKAVIPWARTFLIVVILGILAFFILSNAASIGKLRTGLDTANQKLESVGLEPVEVEGSVPGAQGPKGEPGRAPTAAEIAVAVANYCTVYDCRGPAGEDGEDGVHPTPEQIAEAVTAYCEAHGGCQGPAGTDGADGAPGKDGADSTVPGPQGPKGDTGSAGRGISSITCTAENNWSVVYTDDTTQTIEGPCRIGTVPPEEGETP